MKHPFTLMRESIGRDPTEKNVMRELFRNKHIRNRGIRHPRCFERVIKDVHVLALACRTTLTNRQLRNVIRRVSIKKCRHCGRF